MSRLGASYTSEIVQVGGAEGVGSLKFSVQAYASECTIVQRRARYGAWFMVRR